MISKQTNWTRQCNPYGDNFQIIKKEMKAPVKLVTAANKAGASKGVVKSPLPGTITALKVKVGDVVKEGQTVVVLEAMKMQNNLDAVCEGKVAEIKVAVGDAVKENTILVVIE
ncbi:MAG: biotin/lipoyl-binding protein [Bacteroidaceae bacterium]|nr:biotin/lipoyl-binding protein [Bacteroidaceae bacterium]